MPPADAQALVRELLEHGKATVFGVEVETADVEVAFEAKEGYAAAGNRHGVVVLDTRLTDELRDLGLVRELLNRMQTMRKEMSLDFTDRIKVWVSGSERVTRIARAHERTIASECLAVSLSTDASPSAVTVREVDVEGESVRLGITKA